MLQPVVLAFASLTVLGLLLLARRREWLPLLVAISVIALLSLLNGRLARHYGVPGVSDELEFQKVALPPESHRGGVLTMAAVLKVTANGTTTSPILRGAWVHDRLLGTPSFASRTRRAFDAEDILFFRAIAKHVARARHRARTRAS